MRKVNGFVAILSAGVLVLFSIQVAAAELSCYSDRQGNNLIKTMTSVHNCCKKKTGGKSWSCSKALGDIPANKTIKCDAIKSGPECSG